MDREHVPFPLDEEGDVLLSELSGAVFVRPRVHRTISRPTYCPAAEEVGMGPAGLDNLGGASQRQSAAASRLKFDTMTLGTTRWEPLMACRERGRTGRASPRLIGRVVLTCAGRVV